MAASEHLNPQLFQLFHGTGGQTIEGGVIRTGHVNAFSRGTYATNEKSVAARYAKQEAKNQGRLFGTIFEVAPESDPEGVTFIKDPIIMEPGVHFFVDPKGMRPIKAVSFPLNPKAVGGP